MPKAIEDKLARRATKLGLKGKRRKAFIFGTLARIEKSRKKK